MQNSNWAPHSHGRFYASAFYFLFFGGLAGLYPYLTLYFEQLGLTGSQIGYLASLPPILTLLSSPFWTSLADTSGRHRLVLSIGILGTVCSTLLLMQAKGLFWLTLSIVGIAFFVSAIIPLADNATLNTLGGEKSQYGKVRLWGSVGWGISSPLIGKLIDHSGIKAGFSTYVVLIMVGLLVSFGLTHTQTRLRSPFWQAMRQLLADRRWISFLGLAAVAGMGVSVMNSYLLLFLNKLGATKTLMGLMMTIATLSEIPILFFMNRMLQRWGARRLLAFSMAAYAARAWLTSLVHVPWTLLPLQALHGPTFAVLQGAGVALANQISPEGLSATGQGLFSATSMGIGAAAGAILGGWLYQVHGAPVTFQVMGGIALATLFIWLTLGKGLKEDQA